MISPYLRRPLRSLEEMLTRTGDATPAGKVRMPSTPPVTPSPQAIDPASADKESTIASNR